MKWLARLILLCTAVGYAHADISPLLHVSQGGGGNTYVGPGDIVASATAWYGLRGYKSGYTGKSINLCTPADAACEDESIGSNGKLVLGATGQTCNNSSTKCIIKTWYDQTGNGNNLTQATAADQATFVVPGQGTACTLQTLPCATFAAGQFNTVANFNGGADIAQPYSFSIFANSSNSNTGSFKPIFASIPSPVTTASEYTADSTQINLFVGTNNGENFLSNFWRSLQGVANGSSSIVTIDSSTTSSVVAGAQPFYHNNVYVGTDTVSNWIGTLSEFGIWASALTSPQLALLDANQQSFYNPLAFEKNGWAIPWASNSFGQPAFHDVNTNTDWFAWQGAVLVTGSYTQQPEINTYNETTQVWTGPNIVSTIDALGAGDPHGMPTCVAGDRDGSSPTKPYVYCFHGAHNTAVNISSTKTAGDPTSFSDCTTTANFGTNITFPEPVYVGGKIYVFYTTGGTGGGTEETVAVSSFTPTAGACGTVTTKNLFDATAASSWLPPTQSFLDPDGVNIDVLAIYGANGVGGAEATAYWIKYNTSTGTVCNVLGSGCIVSGSQPGTLANLNANYLAYTGTNIGSPVGMVNGSISYMLLSDGATSPAKLNEIENAGVSWSSATTLFTYPSGVNGAAGYATIRTNSQGNPDVYFADGSEMRGDGQDEGAIQRTTKISGSWSSPSVVLAYQGGAVGVDVPVAVLNGTAAASVIMSEACSYTNTTPCGMRGYVVGEGGDS